MKNYLLLWILLTVLATAALMLVLNGWAELYAYNVSIILSSFLLKIKVV